METGFDIASCCLLDGFARKPVQKFPGKTYKA
jgi:hypothetical protein